MKNFGRKGVEWDSKVELILGLANIVKAIDWLSEELKTEDFARNGVSVVVRIREGKEESTTGLAANYRRNGHKISIINRGNSRASLLCSFVHELVHAFQFKHTVGGKVVSFKASNSVFETLSVRAKYAGQVRGKAYLSKPIEIQAFAVQYKYTRNVLELDPTIFSGNRIGCYRKLGIDILNVL